MTRLTRATTPRLKTAEQIIESLEPHFEELQRHREARRLGMSLLLHLHIQPDGIQCVCLLADATCKNNAEAITRWVGQELLDPDLRVDPGTSPMDHLLRRLNRHLLSLEAANA